MKTIYFAFFLRCPLGQQSQKRVMLMGRLAADRGYALKAVTYGITLDMTFPAPRSMQRQQFKILIIHIKTGGKHFGQIDLFSAFISNSDASCNSIIIRKYAVIQLNLQREYPILQNQAERLTVFFCSKGCGKTFQFGFSFLQFISGIEKFQCRMSRFGTHFHTVFPEIAYPVGRIFHRKRI